MKILVIGSGGREHAIVWKLHQSPLVTKIFCAPGNPGTAVYATSVEIKADNLEALLKFAQENQIDLTVVGPEGPLAAGIVDMFEAAGLKIFGPTKAAAKIEYSKAFAKDFMVQCGIPTALHRVFTNAEEAIKYIRSLDDPRVAIKADGLAAGKGVIVSDTAFEAIEAFSAMMHDRVFGTAGETILVEKRLFGPEVSFMVFTDGSTVKLCPPSQDHKRLLDGDRGPNTGGMGAYAPVPFVTEDMMKFVYDAIALPLIFCLKRKRITYKGVIYIGAMITEDGIKVIECNCRLGDPETQPLLQLLKSDLAELMMACTNGTLHECHLKWHSGYSAAVVLASKEYPDSCKTGKPINIGTTRWMCDEGTILFQAGTNLNANVLLTAGGRVLAPTSLAPTLAQAVAQANAAAQYIDFDGKQYRTDIGAQGLEYLAQQETLAHGQQ